MAKDSELMVDAKYNQAPHGRSCAKIPLQILSFRWCEGKGALGLVGLVPDR